MLVHPALAAQTETTDEIGWQSLIDRADQAEQRSDNGPELALRRDELAFAKAHFGPDDIRTLQSATRLGFTLSSQGRLDEADLLLTAAVAALERVAGTDSADTLRALAYLAIVREHQQRLPEAEALLLRALAGQQSILPPDHPDTLRSLSNLARLYRAQNRNEDAERVARQALDGRTRVFGREDYRTLGTQTNLAFILIDLKRFDEAETLLNEALVARTKSLGPAHNETIETLHSLFALDIERKSPTFEGRGAAILARLNAAHGADSAEIMAEQVYQADQLVNDHPADALKRYRVVAQWKGAASADENALVQQSRLNTGLLSKDKAEAEANYRAIIAATSKSEPAGEVTATAMLELGRITSDDGRLGEAEPLLRGARDLRRAMLAPDAEDVLLAISLYASFLRDLGRIDEAIALDEEALVNSGKISEPGENILNIKYNLSNYYTEKKDIPRAVALMDEAIAGFAKIYAPDSLSMRSAEMGLANRLVDQGKLAEAEALYEKILATYERELPPSDPGTITVVKGLAHIYQLRGKVEQARTLFVRAVIAAEETLSQTNAERVSCFQCLGEFLGDDLKRPDLGIFFLKRAVNELQRIRVNMRALDRTNQSTFVRKWLDAYVSLQRQLTATGQFATAEQVGRMIKEQEYFDFVSEREAGAGRAAATLISFSPRELEWKTQLAAWGDRPTRLAMEMADLKARMADKTVLSPGDEARYQDLSAAYDSAYSRYKAQINGWLADNSALTDPVVQDEARRIEAAASERLQGVIADIGPDVALLSMVAFEDKVHLFLITPDGLKHATAPIGRADLFTLVRETRALIDLEGDERDQKLKTQLSRLYDLLLRPIEQDLVDAKTQTLMLNLQGNLRYAPMAALFDGRDYLIQKVALAYYTPSSQTRFLPYDGPIKGMGFGITRSVGGHVALPKVLPELQDILGTRDAPGLIPGNYKLDDQFSRAALETASAGANNVLHIASHFGLTSGRMDQSYLLLGDGSHLTLQDINLSPKLRFRGVDLLTLSACETAVGIAGTGMEIEGLGALIENKGASSVLATLWNAADASVGKIMHDFYDGYGRQRLSKARALQEAQVRMIASSAFGDPYFWAPYVLLGNWK